MSPQINKRKDKTQKVKEMSVGALEKALASLPKKQKSKVIKELALRGVKTAT